MSLEGKEICRCGNPSGQYCGMTCNSKSQTVLDFWCKDCGGTIEALANIKVKIRKIKDNKPKQCCEKWKDLYYKIIFHFPNLQDKINFCPECKSQLRKIK